ncbi:FtsX-like permease family protein [Cryptosporangium sp. NPDC048952]|uniref:FtsX-like permease family protein n=1 Tax=Cryptosporangium sp. NPDC048952 TaxID=3363961 RepID=UPI00371C43DD
MIHWPSIHWPSIHWPSIHWPSVRGRARADRGPLLLVAAVVLVVTLLAAAVPPLMRSTADDAARDSIRRAGPDAAVQVEALFNDDYGPTGGRLRDDDLAGDVENVQRVAVDKLVPELRTALRAPVTAVTSVSLLVTDGSVQRRFQLNYVLNDHGGPAVTWLAGHAPRGTAEGDVETPYAGPPWEAQVGLSEANAAALNLRPGDHIELQDEQRNPYNVLVSGIFRPVDANDAAWGTVPWVLRPVPGLDGAGTTRMGGLLSAESLPDGRLALLPDQFRRTVWFTPDADALTWDSAQRLADTVTALKAGSGSSAQTDAALKWDTQLDGVLRDVQQQVTAAQAQASVLLIAVLAGAVLVLLLAADLLARRRSAALITARERGASLPGVASELLLESLAVTLPAVALGLGLSALFAGGAALPGAAVVGGAALVAGPVFGTLVAARATRDRRAPANRAARRWQERTRQLRRAAVDVAFVAAAAGAVVALRQRGVEGGSLAAAAPALGLVAGTLLLLRSMPAGIGLVLRQTLRSRLALAVFGAARAAATAARALPLLVLVTTIGLATFALTLDTTAARGTVEGAWRTVGADARLDVAADATGTTADLARTIGAAPGVTQVATAQIDDSVRVIAGADQFTPSLMITDAAALERLLAGNPLPDAPDLNRLKRTSPIPVLVRTHDDSLRPGMSIQLIRESTKPLDLVAVGVAPAVNDDEDVIVMDASAAPDDYVPNTIWANGPGAAHAMADAEGRVLTQAAVLHDRQVAPLNAGLTLLERAAAATLLLLGLLGFALSAAASAPERWVTLARLRTLGLRPRDTHRVAAAELLPPVLVAIVCGPLLGLLLVKLTFGALSLRTLTDQTEDPVTVLPWWPLGAMAVTMIGMLAAIVAAEAATRRKRRLGDVLRVGG